MSWKKSTIGNHVVKIMNWNPIKEIPKEIFHYIDLSSVNKETKEIDENSIQKILGEEAPSRAKQLVKSNDVLIATVRPNLNGVALLEKNYINATASTGYCILRTNSDLISKYLYYWVRSSFFVKDMTNKASGASYPAVSDKIIKESKIPFPPLAEQKKIAAILDEADKLRKMNLKLLKKYDALTQSIFLDMFGDPVNNSKGWEVKNLKDISTKIHSGTTPKGGNKVYVPDGIVFFRSQNVWRNKIVYENVAFIDEKTHTKMNKSSLKNKDILMTKTGRINTENSSLGRAAIYLGDDDRANVNGHVYLIRLQKDIIHEFVLFILSSKLYRKYIRSVCVGGIDKRQINKEHLELFPIIFPPTKLQKQFAERIKIIETQKIQAQAALKSSENLFNSLLQKAFKGELTKEAV